jgi:hypothetical protein
MGGGIELTVGRSDPQVRWAGGVPIMARYKFNYGAVLVFSSMKIRYTYETQMLNGTLFARYTFFWDFFRKNYF